MKIVPSTYEIRNAVLYFRTLAIFRSKMFIDKFWYVLFFHSASIIDFFVVWIKFFLKFFAEKNDKLKVCLIFCRNTTLQPPVVRLTTLTSLAVLFNPGNTVSCEIGGKIRLWAVWHFKNCSKQLKKIKVLQVCCPSEMQISSNCLLEEFGNINYMFGTYNILSYMTCETFLRLSDWCFSIESSITLIVFERPEKFE